MLREPPHQAFAAEALALRQLVRAVPDDAREEQVDLVDLGATTARVVLDARVRIAERRDHRRTGGQRPALDAYEVEQRIAAARALEIEEGDEVPAVGPPLQQQVGEVQVVMREAALDAFEGAAPLFVVLDHGLV